MVREANVKAAAAEKALKEARMQVRARLLFRLSATAWRRHRRRNESRRRKPWTRSAAAGARLLCVIGRRDARVAPRRRSIDRKGAGQEKNVVQQSDGSQSSCVVLGSIQVEVLEAEVTALKTLVITSTPSQPNLHRHPTMASSSVVAPSATSAAAAASSSAAAAAAAASAASSGSRPSTPPKSSGGSC